MLRKVDKKHCHEAIGTKKPIKYEDRQLLKQIRSNRRQLASNDLVGFGVSP